jgi:SAM-dependent methyltransferase
MFRSGPRDTLGDGVTWCRDCHNWYPIENELLELLPPPLAYRDDKKRFWLNYERELRALDLGLKSADHKNGAPAEEQRKQQEHFDWYGSNDQQTYNSYEQMPFWKAVDASVFPSWRQQLKPNSWLLDVGCAQGRATFNFADLPVNIVGLDISKVLIRQAITRYRRNPSRANVTFFVGDGANLPFTPGTFDYALIYGVLHHLPNPAQTCLQVARILRPGGLYFGCENNQTVFRKTFDLAMKLKSLWHEEAGAQPLISAKQLTAWFAGTSMNINCCSQVFVLPHAVNLLGQRWGAKLMNLTDRIGRVLPFVRKNGGLIMIHGQKLHEDSISPAVNPAA